MIQPEPDSSLMNAGRRLDNAMGEISDGHPDEQGDHHGPDHHAERAKHVDGVEGLGPQPDNERKAECHARLEAQPIAS
jgi:hypothetical protein